MAVPIAACCELVALRLSVDAPVSQARDHAPLVRSDPTTRTVELDERWRRVFALPTEQVRCRASTVLAGQVNQAPVARLVGMVARPVLPSWMQ
jgi:hypothetical protein